MFPEKILVYDRQVYDGGIVGFESLCAPEPVTKCAVKPFIQVVLIKQVLQVHLAYMYKTRAKISVEYLFGRLDTITQSVADQYARQAKCLRRCHCKQFGGLEALLACRYFIRQDKPACAIYQSKQASFLFEYLEKYLIYISASTRSVAVYLPIIPE